ncbi:MAG: chaperone modulator CbpM [Rhodospirillales bacterium]|jgi:chaperone modulatory protein CbpM|nr:chaperone modulator CbpM [Rhodospirillales bacterium]
MMMKFNDIIDMVEALGADDLTVWVERGWVRPDGEGDDLVFTQIDVARVRLIAECRYELEIDDEAIPVILSLLDQVYGLRRELASLVTAIDGQPDAIRAEIMRAAAAVEIKE